MEEVFSMQLFFFFLLFVGEGGRRGDRTWQGKGEGERERAREIITTINIVLS